MPLVIIEVMPKPEILDPQGKAITASLARKGHEGIAGVRMGKRFEIELDEQPTDEKLAELRTIAGDMLANSVIEDVVDVRVAEHGESWDVR